MAPSKSKSQKAKGPPASGSDDGAKSGSKSAREVAWLRTHTDPRTERRFLPRSSGTFAISSWLLSSGGALALGAGVYAQLLRGAGPHPNGFALLAGGAVALLVGLFVQGRALGAVRVGDAGVAIERGDTTERLAWHEIDAIRIASGVLTFSGAGKIVPLSIEAHADAAGLALSEARARIPARAAGIEEKPPLPSSSSGEVVSLADAQVAGLRCRVSDRIISFEKDARLCGRCGQAYHREDVPKRCLDCDAFLA